MSDNAVDPEEAAASFFELLGSAAAAVAEPWFLLPVAPTDSSDETLTYRERVYCYELYHQIRSLSEKRAGSAGGDSKYVLSGEIDKAGINSVVECGQQKPDMVWHKPGSFRYNAVVLEVKAATRLTRGLLRKDLQTLAAFVESPRGYERGALLVYGSDDRTALRATVLRAADDLQLSNESRRRIQLLSHPAVHQHIENLGTLRRTVALPTTAARGASSSS